VRRGISISSSLALSGRGGTQSTLCAGLSERKGGGKPLFYTNAGDWGKVRNLHNLKATMEDRRGGWFFFF